MSGCVGDSSVVTDATTDGTTNSDGGSGNDVATTDGPTGCAARTADDTAGVFVAPSGSDVNSCGTRTNACKTLTYAIATAKAASAKTTIYVAGGTYAESVTLDAALTIEGGWADSGGSWTPVCGSNTSTVVTIQGVTNTTVHVLFTGAATLRNVKVTSKAAADPGETLYGIFVVGSTTNLTLDQVVVDIAAGGVGDNGVAGGSAVDATDAGCTANNGAPGTSGTAGAGGPAGSFSTTGYAATSGGDAGAGGTGQAGTSGGAGACATCSAFVGSCPGSCGFGSKVDCASDGKAGCGGGGGGGGSAGTGGGSSIAVFVWDAHLTVFGGTFTTSNGGNGGVGGSGADGGADTTGIMGTPGLCPTSLSGPTCSGGFCTGFLNASYNLTGGTAGGSGGVGGQGGQGGGGSGGVSIDIVQGGDGGVTLNGSPTLAHGDGGTGGAAGGTNGAASDRFP